MFNNFKYLILILVLLGILLPETVSAFVIGETTAIFKLILAGISEKTMWMTFLMMMTAIVYVVLIIMLFFSLIFLPQFIIYQTPWMKALEPMTTAGWEFVVGLANMFLIIIFVVIAFAFIFKIESLQAKKSLVKLIVIAILMNFSLLFVNMAIDISQVFYNTIIGAAGGTEGLLSFFGIIQNMIVGPAIATALILVGISIALIVLFAIPYVNAIAQVVFAAMFFPVILPLLLFLIIQMTFFLPLAAMFMTFAFLFAARVFVLQILAILSPLAFVSLILPQTKFFWGYWLKTFTQWLIMGVAFLFLLILGLSMLQLLVPTLTGTIDPNIPQPFYWIIKSLLLLVIFYFALFIYLAVVLYIGKNFLPQGTQGVLGAFQGMGNTIMNRGVGLASGPLKRIAARQGTKGLEKKEAQRAEHATRIAKQLEEKGGSGRLSLRQMAETGVMSFREQTPETMRRVAKEAEMKQKAVRQKEVRRRMAEIKDLSPEEHTASISSQMRKRNPDGYLIEAHMKSANIREIDPELAGQAQKHIKPGKNKIELAKEISPTLFDEYKSDATDPSKGGDPKLSEAAAKLKAATNVIKNATPDRIAMAQGKIDNQNISKEISEIGARRFSDIATPKIFNNIHVFLGMNTKQAESLEERGSYAARQALGRLIENNRTVLRNEIKKLAEEGHIAKATDLTNMLKEIRKNPNFK